MTSDFITIIPNWLPGWLGAGFAAGGGFGVVKWVVEFIAGRIDKRAAALDADTRFVIENLRGELARMALRQEQSDQRLATAEGEIQALRTELVECNGKHAAADAEVARLKAMMQGYGDARDKVQAEHAAEVIALRNGGN